jgi:hypothetical protein
VPGARLASSAKPIALEIALLCSAHTFIAHHVFDAHRFLILEIIPLKNQKEQGGAPQIVRVCTARRDYTVIFDLAMEYLVESKKFR